MLPGVVQLVELDVAGGQVRVCLRVIGQQRDAVDEKTLSHLWRLELERKLADVEPDTTVDVGRRPELDERERAKGLVALSGLR